MHVQTPLRSAFLALPLEGEAKWQFQAYQEALRFLEDCVSFQAAATPHLTLIFWKELFQIEYDQMLPQAEKIAASSTSFMLQVNGADTFGERGEDRVLFLTVAFSPQLADVKKRCPWPQAQPFHPHITLARITHPQRFIRKKKEVMKVLKDIAFDMTVDRLRLYAEVNGVKQTPLQDFMFRSSGFAL